VEREAPGEVTGAPKPVCSGSWALEALIERLAVKPAEQ
jgi:hypothetical protein